jgi:hypothetical protein
MKQEWKRDPGKDWTYSEGCGCRVTFFADANYKTSRMLPGETCTAHGKRHQVAERDYLIERARQALQEYLELPLN